MLTSLQPQGRAQYLLLYSMPLYTNQMLVPNACMLLTKLTAPNVPVRLCPMPDALQSQGGAQCLLLATT